MSKKKLTIDVSAMAFFNGARGYHEAAGVLFDSKVSSSNPVYFLYFHTMELALKAFLRACELPVLGTKRESHKLTELYEECRRLGFTIGPDDLFQIGNIASLMEQGNKFQGFRYFNIESVTLADLSWVREVVDDLMHAVEPHVVAHAAKHPTSKRAAKGVLVLGKPVPK